MAKMLGFGCEGCGRNILDSGDKCNHCGRPHSSEQQNAQKWYHNTKEHFIDLTELNPDPAIADNQVHLAVLETAVHCTVDDGSHGMNILTLPFPEDLERTPD